MQARKAPAEAAPAVPALSGQHGWTKVWGGPCENQAGSTTPTLHKMLVYAPIQMAYSESEMSDLIGKYFNAP